MDELTFDNSPDVVVNDGQQADPVATGEPVEPQNPTTQEAATAVTPDPATSTVQLGDSGKEISRLIGAMKNLQAENATLKSTNAAAVVTEPTATPDPGKVETDPVARIKALGYEVDYDGLVNYKGTDVTPEFALAVEDAKADSTKFTDWQNTQAEEKYNADVSKAKSDLIGVVNSAIVGIREQHIPGLPADISPDVDEYMLSKADAYITSKAGSLGDITSELVEAAANHALNQAKRIFGHLGDAQIKANVLAGRMQPVRNGGKATLVGGKSYNDMTPDEKHAHGVSLAERALAKHGFN